MSFDCGRVHQDHEIFKKMVEPSVPISEAIAQEGERLTCEDDIALAVATENLVPEESRVPRLKWGP